MINRYASQPMVQIWSNSRRQELYRKIWMAVCRVQRDFYKPELGLYQDFRATLETVDSYRLYRLSLQEEAEISQLERECGHELEASRRVFQSTIHRFCNLPLRDVVHFDMTSSDVMDTADAIQMAASLTLIKSALKAVVSLMLTLSEKHIEGVTCGYTHLVEAEITTQGYRLAGHLLEFAEILRELNSFVFPIKGVRGPVGLSSAMYMHGDPYLPKRVMEILGESEDVSLLTLSRHATQTSPRHYDFHLVTLFDRLFAAIHRLSITARFLHSVGSWTPIRRQKTGSSAMPAKSNPQAWETLCSLSQLGHGYAQSLWSMTANQVAERTLDDSALRRVVLPDLFSTVENCLHRLSTALGNLHMHQFTHPREIPVSGLSSFLLSEAIRTGAPGMLREQHHAAAFVHPGNIDLSFVYEAAARAFVDIHSLVVEVL